MDCRQSIFEGALLPSIKKDLTKHDEIIINAYTNAYMSMTIINVLPSCESPVTELHIPDVCQRELTRHLLHIKNVAYIFIVGFECFRYKNVFEFIAKNLKNSQEA